MNPRMRWVSRVVKRFRTEWAVLTVIFYLIAIPVTVIIFPNNSLWVALLIVSTGLFDALNSLADRLGETEADKDETEGVLDP